MGFIDTHSHIYGEEFNEDIDVVIARAKEVGIDKIFLPNINFETISQMLTLCDRYPSYLCPMMGLHPTDVTPNYKNVLKRMENELIYHTEKYIAIGEVGLDFYWETSMATEQEEAFEEQICWASRMDLPLVIHARSAHAKLVEMMERHRAENLRGIFHCFNGTEEEADELLSFSGFLLGIGGTLTYKKSTLPDVLKKIPMSRIVIETDSPYLAPVPYRGKRNESAYAAEILTKIASVYETAKEQVIEQTNINVKRIFKHF